MTRREKHVAWIVFLVLFALTGLALQACVTPPGTRADAEFKYSDQEWLGWAGYIVAVKSINAELQARKITPEQARELHARVKEVRAILETYNDLVRKGDLSTADAKLQAANKVLDIVRIQLERQIQKLEKEVGGPT